MIILLKNARNTKCLISVIYKFTYRLTTKAKRLTPNTLGFTPVLQIAR